MLKLASCSRMRGEYNVGFNGVRVSVGSVLKTAAEFADSEQLFVGLLRPPAQLQTILEEVLQEECYTPDRLDRSCRALPGMLFDTFNSIMNRLCADMM